ncbi:YybH family protein [Spirosoma areae]
MKISQFTQIFNAFAALLVFAAGCTTASKERGETFDKATVKTEIEAANSEFMDLVSKGDSVGLANSYALDAKLMGPNGPAMTGRKSIQTGMAGIINSGIAKADLKVVDVWGGGDIVAEEGELTLFDKAGTQLDKGKYIVLWKKEDGKWKLFRDLFNSDLPLPSAK